MDTDTFGYFIVDFLLLSLQLLSAIGNGFIICLFLASKRLRQNQCIRLLLLLCITDWGYVISTLPLTCYYLTNWDPDALHYDSEMVLYLGSPSALHYKLNLVITNAIAVDRLQAMYKPAYYRSKNHNHYALITLAIGLTFGVIDIFLMFTLTDLDHDIPNCAALLCFQHKMFRQYWVISNFILNCLVLLLTIWVAFELKHQRDKFAEQTSQMYGSNNHIKENRTGDKLSFAILMVSVICLLIPSSFVAVTNMINPKLLIYLGPFYFVAMVCAGVLNSIIYITLHPEIRRAFRTLVVKHNFKVDPALTIFSTEK